MAISSTFYGRGDGATANNAALNVQNTSTILTQSFYFETGTLGAGTTGDLNLDQGSGVIDTDTTVWVGGVEYEFSYEFSGTLPNDNKMLALGIIGEPVTVITLHGGALDGQRLFYLQDEALNADSSIMDAFPNGARSLDNFDDVTPPPPVCFTKGTMIRCENGEVAIEDLNVGDLVVTASGKLEKIKWIGERHLSKLDLVTNPKFFPVKIAKGALGENKPHSDLQVSQQHRMLLEDWRLELMIGGTEALVSAKNLVNDSSIRINDEADGVVYFHILFETHQVIYANGTLSESFHPGQWALDTLQSDVREELVALFPELADGAESYGPTARPTLKTFEVNALNAA